MTTLPEQTPSPVPETAQQEGDVLLRWSWTERAVWTERMLTALEQGVKGGCWFRLMDKVFAERTLALVRQWVADNGLTLHPAKTKIVDVRKEGFEFLGYRFVKHRRFPRRKSLAKFKDAIRAKTKRTSGDSLTSIVTNVNRTLRGWFTYFQHSHRNTFRELDGWIRMRLRSILRKRCGRRGKGRGLDHYRWPNAFFAQQGLFTLMTAHAMAVQSSRR